MKRWLLAVLLMAWCGQALAAIATTITTSRTSCKVPCAVFFDLTASTGLSGTNPLTGGGDYVSALDKWDFDSTAVAPSDPHRYTQGFAVAHVYQTAGTYVASVSGVDASGVTFGPTTVTITVSAMTGTTYYVASSGSDSNNGTSMTTPYLTVPKGNTKGQIANNTVLFRRGDTFSGLTDSWRANGVTGPINVGSYSDPNAPSSVNPILDFGANTPLLLEGADSDLRFMDLTIQTTSGAGFDVLGGANNMLALRLDISGSPTVAGHAAFSAWQSTGTFVVDCHLHHFEGYGWYVTGPQQAAAIGNAIDDVFGQYHGIRFQACQETSGSPGVCGDGTGKGNLEYAAENVVNNPSSFTSIEFHGDNSNIVLIGNSGTNAFSAGPENTTSIENVYNVLFDGNALIGDYEYGMNVKHGVLRNNVLIGSTGEFLDIGAGTQLASGFVDEIYLYNNTAYGSPGMLIWNQTTGGTVVKIQNNVLYNTRTAGAFSTIVAGSPTITENHNLTYAPNFGGWTHPSGTGDVYGDPVFTTTPPTTAAMCAIQSTSPAKYVGTTVAAYRDFTGLARPQGAQFSMGAFDVGAGGVGGSTASSADILLMCL